MPRAPMRVCAQHGCPRLQPERMCLEHRRQHERVRGTTTERGYGHTHQQLRERWRPAVEAGRVRCARCHRPIATGSPWDLGHRDEDRRRYAGPEHEACNRATAARRRA
ncbi:hypothetical protein [Rhodococcus sp. NPDC003348]